MVKKRNLLLFYLNLNKSSIFVVIYVFSPGKNLKYIKGLNVDLNKLNDSVCIEANVTSFSRVDSFKNKEYLKGYPRYYFSNNNTMKRVMDEKDSSLYVHKSFTNSKTRIPFLSFSKKNRKD